MSRKPRRRRPDIGWARYRRNGEFHAANPGFVKAMQRALRTGDPDDFAAYDSVVNDRDPYAIRDLLRFVPHGDPMPLDDVEPIETIVRRFTTTAMSIGALSPEAHSTLSKARTGWARAATPAKAARTAPGTPLTNTATNPTAASSRSPRVDSA